MTTALLLTASTALAQSVEFGQVDINDDGYLDAAELLAIFDVAGLELMSRDRNGDAVLSRSELRDDRPDNDATRPGRRGGGYAASSRTSRTPISNAASLGRGNPDPGRREQAAAASSNAVGAGPDDGSSPGESPGNSDADQGNGLEPSGSDGGHPGQDSGEEVNIGDGNAGNETNSDDRTSPDNTAANDAGPDTDVGTGSEDAQQTDDKDPSRADSEASGQGHD